MINNGTINRIAVIGYIPEATLIAFHLANSGSSIGFFDLSKQSENHFSFEEFLIKKPELLYSKDFLDKIEVCDNSDLIKSMPTFDWIVIVPDAGNTESIKDLLSELSIVIRINTLISLASDNQSIRLPLNLIPTKLKPAFTGARFFEPFRKCGLVEIVSLPETESKALQRIKNFFEEQIGKYTLLCQKNGFADRLICFIQIWSLRTGLNLGFDLEQINVITGKVMGGPGKGIIDHIDTEGPESFYAKSKKLFHESPIPDENDSYIFLNLLVMPPSGYFTETGKVFDPLKGRYKKLKKKKMKGLLKYKSLGLKKRLPLLLDGSTRYHQFYQEFWRGLFKYISQIVEKKECDIQDVEMILKEVLEWEVGLFEIWNILGIRLMVRRMEIQNNSPEPWVYEMLEKGDAFFKSIDDRPFYYDVSGDYNSLLENSNKSLSSSKSKAIWHNDGASICDLGEGVLNLEIKTYRNIIDEDVVNGILKSVDLAEKEKKGLIISAPGKDFTIGANLGMVFFAAIEKNYKLINHYVSEFQHLTSRLRYSDAPIVILPKGLTLGGGCEMSLHCDRSLPLAEAYIGLPEALVGLVPAGGGTKEMALQLICKGASYEAYAEVLLNLSQGKISTSAFDAKEMNYIGKDDDIIMNKYRQMAFAQEHIAKLLVNGYRKPISANYKAGGKTLFNYLERTIHEKPMGNTPFEEKIARHIAKILSGGEVQEGQQVSEQHFLDLEREAFLSLCGERETLQRLKKILSGRKK